MGPHLGEILGTIREVYNYYKHSVPCYLLKVGIKDEKILQSGGASREASLPARTDNVNFVMTSHVKTFHLFNVKYNAILVCRRENPQNSWGTSVSKPCIDHAMIL